MNQGFRLSTSAVLLAAWYAGTASANLEIYSATVDPTTRTLYIDGSELTLARSIQPVVRFNGQNLTVLPGASPDHVEASIPASIQLVPYVTYAVSVSSFAPGAANAATQDLDIATHRASLSLFISSDAETRDKSAPAAKRASAADDFRNRQTAGSGTAGPTGP